MEFTSPQAEERWASVVRAAATTVVGLDFDGTLAPIVADPAAARIHPDAAEVLVALAAEVRALAVVTGRPAHQALALGSLEELGEAVGATGKELLVFGQYGNERWSSRDPRIVTPPPPPGLAPFTAELPALLDRAGAGDAWVEEKGLAVAVHTRRLPDPAAAQARLLDPLSELASRHGLALEPGRHVLEVRAPGMHKGMAVRTIAAETEAGGLVFVGDDLGDLEAFEAVADLGRDGMPTLLACSASEEQTALVDRADVVVPGPDGVMALLRRLTEEAARG